MSQQNGFYVLCTPTARSQAYLQAIAGLGMRPDHVVVYGNKTQRSQTRDSKGHHMPINQPDFSCPLKQTISDAGWSVTYVDEEQIDSEALLSVLTTLPPKLTVFSGFGGQLVPAKVIQLSGPLLHIHSGWLPDYRGSTTLYYSLLKQGQCAASALLLTEDIDAGPVLARQMYPAPDSETDIDYAYDCAIRADLLVSVLRNYLSQGELPEPMALDEDGEMYFVIHPLLKHLAMLSLKEPGDGSRAI
jgi:methionyl-tRNA formyltransferase